MKVFVFLEKDSDQPNCKFNIGLLNESDRIEDKLVVIRSAPASQVRDLINQVPTECIFVGRDLRQGVLTELLHQLCSLRLDLPEKLKFHWVPPYKMPLEDINWLYNFGTFNESSHPSWIEIGNSLGIKVSSSGDHIQDMAKIYFTLIGDFSKL